MEPVIHFASVMFGTARPCCGSWRGGTNWTTLPELVTCPACARRLGERQTRGEPVRVAPVAAPAQRNGGASRSNGRLWSWTW